MQTYGYFEKTITNAADARAWEINIPGVNADQALHVFDGDYDLYLTVLRSYADNTPAVLGKIRHVSEDTLPGYAICVHGLKSASGSICAENISERAAELEDMAKAGNLSGVLAENDVFLRDAENLVKGISAWLDGPPAKDDAK